MSRGLKLRRVGDRRKSYFLRGSSGVQRGFRRGESAATCSLEGAAIIRADRAAATSAISCTG